MKKILALLMLVIGITNLNAQGPKDIFQSCVTAMRLDKLDSVMTVSIKAYLYAQTNRTSVRYYSKDYGDPNNSDGEDVKIRLELSAQGKEDVFIFADEEIFQIIPKYEEIDTRNAGQLYEIMGYLMTTGIVSAIAKDTSDAAIYTLHEGTTKFNDKNCKKISVAAKETPDEIGRYYYFDEATNWFQGMDIPVEKRTIGVVLTNFKKAKGIVYPAVVKLLDDGKKALEIEIDKFELDIALEDSLFQTKK